MNPAGVLRGAAPPRGKLGWGAAVPGWPGARADQALRGAAHACAQARLGGLQVLGPC